MKVTLAFAASHEKQFIATLDVPERSTIAEVIAASKVCELFPAIDFNENKVGIASQVATLDTIVQPGDRVEIYRPLIFDPMTARRLRAKK